MTQRNGLQSQHPLFENREILRGEKTRRTWAPIAQTSLQPCPLLLLVCDEELTRRVLKVVLETAGYRVIEALSVNEGMRQCAPPANRPEMAVIVSTLDRGIWASLDILRSALEHPSLLVMSPDEVGWLLDSLDGQEKGFQGQWLERIRQALQEKVAESTSALHMA
jgi:CheY-like chemotaxis protein